MDLEVSIINGEQTSITTAKKWSLLLEDLKITSVFGFTKVFFCKIHTAN